MAADCVTRGVVEYRVGWSLCITVLFFGLVGWFVTTVGLFVWSVTQAAGSDRTPMEDGASSRVSGLSFEMLFKGSCSR